MGFMLFTTATPAEFEAIRRAVTWQAWNAERDPDPTIEDTMQGDPDDADTSEEPVNDEVTE